MCGVIGIVSNGSEPIVSRLVKGLEVLEPRGYDSTGIAVLNGSIHMRKREGKLANLVASLDPNILGSVGIAHTRWATHGKPTDSNAHPHLSADGTVAVAHNGIIENYLQLRARLQQEGVVFQSETDTEVIPNLIARELQNGALDLAQAVQNVLPRLKGEYAILVIAKSHPGELVAASLERPLLIGIGPSGLSIASMEVALVGEAEEVMELSDQQVASLHDDGTYEICAYTNGQWDAAENSWRPISVTAEDSSKGNFGTFMEKEIFEQPQAVRSAFRGRIDGDDVVLPECDDVLEHILGTVPFITAVACGTSYYALCAAKLFFEKLAGVPLIVEHASEFQDREPYLRGQSLCIAVSQSGETADTVGALDRAKRVGMVTLAITNAKGSQLAKLARNDLSVQAGPERAVASTKAYSAQVTALLLLALYTGRSRDTLPPYERKAMLRAIQALPEQISQALECASQVEAIAGEYKHAARMIIIGKGFAVPLAYEGALKIQEIAYLDSVGFPSGELKHGPLALVTDGVPVVAFALNGVASDRVLSNAEEVKARGGEIIAVVSEGSELEAQFRQTAKHVISLPSAPEEMTPILGAIVVQLLALYLGIARGNDVDRPRNLAKSVTVR